MLDPNSEDGCDTTQILVPSHTTVGVLTSFFDSKYFHDYDNKIIFVNDDRKLFLSSNFLFVILVCGVKGTLLEDPLRRSSCVTR